MLKDTDDRVNICTHTHTSAPLFEAQKQQLAKNGTPQQRPPHRLLEKSINVTEEDDVSKQAAASISNPI